jgi:tRNA(His) 5'-end guanylyltransferase
MKEYESVPRIKLEPKVPVIARLDGKAFHTLTRGMDRPWDIRLQACMWNAARTLCENIQGCKIAYVQSDEISLLLTDWEKETTQGWFNYDLEKMCSVSASQVTSAFLVSMMVLFPERRDALIAGKGLPAFDARFWNLPKEEVANYFIWRQQDAMRNSVQMLARSVFSHKQCDRKSSLELKEMLLEKGTAWEEQDNHCKSGACLVKVAVEEDITFERGGVVNNVTVQRSRWITDMETPLFVEDREYISGLL